MQELMSPSLYSWEVQLKYNKLELRKAIQHVKDGECKTDVCCLVSGTEQHVILEASGMSGPHGRGFHTDSPLLGGLLV